MLVLWKIVLAKCTCEVDGPLYKSFVGSNEQAYQGSCQTSMMKLFFENSCRQKAVNYFR